MEIVLDTDIKTYNFLLEIFKPVCKNFTSSDFSFVSKSYDFANSPNYNACSSSERLITVENLRKTQVFSCPLNFDHSSFSDCSFYSPLFEVLQKVTMSSKDSFELVKLASGYGKFCYYAICSIDKQLVYYYFKFDEQKDIEAIDIFDNYITEVSFSLTYAQNEITEDLDTPKKQKNSYLKSLITA